MFSSFSYPNPRRFLLLWISSCGLMIVLEESWIGSGTTSTLEVGWISDLESTSLSSSVRMKDLETSLFYCNSSLWSYNSSWRNSIVSCACWRCTWILARVVLMMFTMLIVDDKIKLLRIWDNWMCVAMLACSLWIRLACIVSYCWCCKHLMEFYNLVAWTLDFTLTWWRSLCLNSSLTLCECFNQLHTISFVVDVALWTSTLDFDTLAWLVVWITCSLALLFEWYARLLCCLLHLH